MRAIGRGGMATVYLAIQESFEREVALKIMSPELAEEQDFSERFLREARIVSQLVHPHIVTVHDVGIKNGHHYLSMQYIDGRDLKELLPELSAQRIFRALKEVAMALNYAGGKGYVHRDVKPENIMLDREDGRAILMDFGIARASRPDNSMTRTGTALGTPHYMSPEQARGAEVDGRSDLYSLGVLFYYLLIGKVPYEADSPVAVGIKHLTEPVPTLPAPLACYQPLLNKLMAKKPEQRYQTGREFCDALEGVPWEPLDQWHQRKEFKVNSQGHDTPVRGTDAIELDIEEGSASTPGARAAIDPTITMPGAATRHAARTTPRSTPTSFTQESLHIPEEDLEARSRPPASSRILPLLLLVVVVAGAGAGAYYLYPVQVEQAWQRALALLNSGDGEATAPSSRSTPEVVAAGDGASADQSPGTPTPGATAPVENDSGVAPQVEGVPGAVDRDPLADLRVQIDEVAADVEQQPQRRGVLLDLYRQVLAIDAADEQALAGIEAQRTAAVSEVQTLIEGQQFDEARALLDTLVSWFPDMEQDETYVQLQSSLQRELSISALLDKAAGYLAGDQLLKPVGENAAETYRAVLELDANNSAARAGLQAVADRYRQLALAQQKKQAYQKALAMVSNGLSVAPNDEGLKTLRAQLTAQNKKQQQVAALLAQAKSFSQQGKLFGKAGSAAQRYLDVLAVEPNNATAKQTLNSLLANRYRMIESSIADRKFDQATAQVEQALEVVPKDERLLGLLLEIESSKPAVETLLLSGSPIESMYLTPKKTVAADRILYIAFHYKNLAQANSVFQALLFDGSRSLQIAAVPVVVSGKEGDARFRIDRPVEGFTEGGYHIDILLAGQRIYTRAFTIAK